MARAETSSVSRRMTCVGRFGCRPSSMRRLNTHTRLREPIVRQDGAWPAGNACCPGATSLKHPELAFAGANLRRYPAIVRVEFYLHHKGLKLQRLMKEFNPGEARLPA